MQITCTQCNIKLNLSDDKIPHDRVISVSCPKCKNKISIDAHKKSGSTILSPQEQSALKQKSNVQCDSAKEQVKSGQNELTKEEENRGNIDSDSNFSLSILEEKENLALIMTRDTVLSGKLKNTLENLGYHPVQSFKKEDALYKMRYFHFNFIALCDDFDGLSSQDFINSSILAYLNSLSMTIRRKIFLALVGVNLKSLDEMLSFAMSSNIVVNVKDIDRVTTFFNKSLKEHEKFYKVFIDTLEEIGRA